MIESREYALPIAAHCMLKTTKRLTKRQHKRNARKIEFLSPNFKWQAIGLDANTHFTPHCEKSASSLVLVNIQKTFNRIRFDIKHYTFTMGGGNGVVHTMGWRSLTFPKPALSISSILEILLFSGIPQENTHDGITMSLLNIIIPSTEISIKYNISSNGVSTCVNKKPPHSPQIP